MSGTPRTDEVTLGEWEYHKAYDEDGCTKHVSALDYEALRDRARQLETELIAAQERLRAVEELLKRWLDFETEPAGMTPEIIHDKALFDAFFGRIDQKNDALVNDTRAALSREPT